MLGRQGKDLRSARELAKVARAYVRGTFAGAATATAAMYWLDPERGRRRRAVLRDRTSHAARRAREAFGRAGRNLAHRTRGLLAEEMGRLQPEAVSDRVLAQRVRAELGHLSSHPKAIEVIARAGHVSLRGHARADEVERTVAGVRRVRGVTHVENQLQVHPETSGIASLQGGERGVPSAALRRWAPGKRLLAALVGVAVMRYGARRHSPVGLLAMSAGGALLARSVADRALQPRLARSLRSEAGLRGPAQRPPLFREPGPAERPPEPHVGE